MNWFDRFINGVMIGVMLAIAAVVMMAAYQIAMNVVRIAFNV